MNDNERDQVRTYALAIFVILSIFIFWVLCILAPLGDSDLAKFLASALVTPFGAIIYFFYRKPKKEVK